ncbi:hypothetical protein AAFF_G00223250 [Aldrovandia affinis]|uniref:CCHC-type domain-containing protein n=1 Tax=Aldrovandia affinis TaxID=143900 RepID=A0AAD7RFJ1_9TELE|nr:hypothetical protein AAFF_G00223250 [Aldrovandia affinis]
MEQRKTAGVREEPPTGKGKRGRVKELTQKFDTRVQEEEEASPVGPSFGQHPREGGSEESEEGSEVDEVPEGPLELEEWQEPIETEDPWRSTRKKEGAGCWIRVLEEEMMGKRLALGDVKALLGKVIGVEKMLDVFEGANMLRAQMATARIDGQPIDVVLQRPEAAPRKRPEGYPLSLQQANRPPQYALYAPPPPAEEYGGTAANRPHPWYCFNCGEDGHIATNCGNAPNSSKVDEKKRQLRDAQAKWDLQNNVTHKENSLRRRAD